MTKWYRFWKKVHGYLSSEKYVYFDDASEETLKNACESWADREPGGHNSLYRYGFEEVDKPPRSALERMIKNKERNIKHENEELKLLLETLAKL